MISSFEEELRAVIASEKAHATLLLVADVEPIAFGAGKILNGYRERLSRLKAVVLTVRENRYRDFVSQCPDLMDWVGLNFSRAEQLAQPLTLRETTSLIRKMEGRYGMSSKTFVKKWTKGQVRPTEEKWLWYELVALRNQMNS